MGERGRKHFAIGATDTVVKGVGISSRVDLALGVRHPKTGGLQTQFSPLPGKGRSAL